MHGQNGSPDAAIEAMIAQHRAEQQAQQMLGLALQQTMQQPAIIKRPGASMMQLVDEGDMKVLLVALPTGERWDIPMSREVQQLLGRALTASDDQA